MVVINISSLTRISFKTRTFKGGFSSSNGSTKAGTQHDGGRMEDILSKAEEMTKGLYDSALRDVRDI